MIQVHHLNNSRSHRILWLLEELGLEYELVRYQRDPVTMAAPAELKTIHPLGKSPVLRDGDLTLAESGAIIEYLVGVYGDGRLRPPAGTEDGLRYLFWLHFAEGSAMPQLLLKLYLSRLLCVLTSNPQVIPFWLERRGCLESRNNFASSTVLSDKLSLCRNVWPN